MPGDSRSRRYGAAQSILFVVFAAAVLLDPGSRTIGGDPVLRVVGDLVCLIGVGLLFLAINTLGRSVQIAPAPRAARALVTHGVYRWLRHPIYTAIVLVVAGLVLRGVTPWGAILGAVIVVFLLIKARYEETLLSARYPEYEEYRRRTRGVLY